MVLIADIVRRGLHLAARPALHALLLAGAEQLPDLAHVVPLLVPVLQQEGAELQVGVGVVQHLAPSLHDHQQLSRVLNTYLVSTSFSGGRREESPLHSAWMSSE